VKFLLVFLVVLVIAWRWRTWREATQDKVKDADSTTTSTADVVACRQCGLHIPARESVVGKMGSYCCSDHRIQMER
jgi:uncharacterized protein